MYEYDTLANAVAALNHAEAEGVVFAAPPVDLVHTPRLWYSLRAGRCPQKLAPLVSMVWLRPIRKPADPSPRDKNCGSR